MPDEGRFFSEQTGYMESVQQMPQQQWIAPQEPANPPRDYVEPASSESTTTEELLQLKHHPAAAWLPEPLLP